MKPWLQLTALLLLTALAGAILYLIAYIFNGAVSRMTPDGKVPVADAGLFTALLLSFREVLALMKSIWEYLDRSESMKAVAASSPNPADGSGLNDANDGRPTGTPSDPVSVEPAT